MESRIRNKEFWTGLLAIVFFGLLIFAGALLVGNDALKMKVENAGFWAPFLFIILKMSTIVITPLGGSPIYLTAESLFGFHKGYVLVLVGDVLGYSVNFFVGRLFGTAILSKVLSIDHYKWLRGKVDKIDNWKKLFITFLTLAPISDALAYVIGLSKIKFRTYFLSVLFGAALYDFLIISFGSAIVKDSKTYVLAIFILLGIYFTIAKFSARYRSE